LDLGPATQTLRRDVLLLDVFDTAASHRRVQRRRCLQAIAAVLDDAAIKWLAAVSSTSDDAVIGVAWSGGLGRRSGGSRV